MPLLFHEHIESDIELGVWDITEDEHWFLHQLLLYPGELRQLSLIKGAKRLEWLAVRHLVHEMSGRNKRGAFLKDEYGKPYLENSVYHVSISHSEGMAAAVGSILNNGVDIQKIVTKLEAVAMRVMRPEELSCIDEATRLEHLHVLWGAKECLYKAYGRKQLDFRQHILIDPFTYQKAGGSCTGTVRKASFEMHFNLNYRIEKGDYMLVYAIEVTK
ncbi:MAG: 4-phosphopantetheinyl transferase [Bacteroidetes bacterium]|nr:MAG: 4-phosphopantetheinyl transferase [Bacteroidota bacterium]